MLCTRDPLSMWYVRSTFAKKSGVKLPNQGMLRWLRRSEILSAVFQAKCALAKYRFLARVLVQSGYYKALFLCCPETFPLIFHVNCVGRYITITMKKDLTRFLFFCGVCSLLVPLYISPLPYLYISYITVRSVRGIKSAVTKAVTTVRNHQSPINHLEHKNNQKLIMLYISLFMYLFIKDALVPCLDPVLRTTTYFSVLVNTDHRPDMSQPCLCMTKSTSVEMNFDNYRIQLLVLGRWKE